MKLLQWVIAAVHLIDSVKIGTVFLVDRTIEYLCLICCHINRDWILFNAKQSSSGNKHVPNSSHSPMCFLLFSQLFTGKICKWLHLGFILCTESKWLKIPKRVWSLKWACFILSSKPHPWAPAVSASVVNFLSGAEKFKLDRTWTLSFFSHLIYFFFFLFFFCLLSH